MPGGRLAKVLSSAVFICDLVRPSSLIDHTWIVDPSTGSCKQPAASSAAGRRERRLRETGSYGLVSANDGIGATQPFATGLAKVGCPHPLQKFKPRHGQRRAKIPPDRGRRKAWAIGSRTKWRCFREPA